MQNPLLRARFAHPTLPGFYSYHLGMEYHADAMEMVFNSHYTNPVQVFRGAGRLAGALQVTQAPQLIFNRQTMRAGIPTIAGQFMLQPLIGDDNE